MITAVKNRPTKAHTEITPAKYLSVDIETENAPEKAILRAIQAYRLPPNIKDDAKKAEKLRDAETRIRTKAALLDEAPTCVVSIRTEREGVIFHDVADLDVDIPDTRIEYLENESELLLALREYLDRSTGPNTVQMGHNILGFDLPKLRNAYGRNRVKVPALLAPRVLDSDRQPIVDTMRMYLRYCSSESYGERMISLKEVSARLGLPKYKHALDGSLVPSRVAEIRTLAKKKKTAKKAKNLLEELLYYGYTDSLQPLLAYLVMTGNAEDMA